MSRPVGRETPARIPAAVEMDHRAKDILLAVLAEIETLRELGAGLADGATRELARLRDLGIPYQPAAWFGGPVGCADRQAYSRTLKRLEETGLVRRITERNRDRATHLQLTAAGLRRALQLGGSRADRAAIAEGLGRTNWGKELAVNLTARRRPASRCPREG